MYAGKSFFQYRTINKTLNTLLVPLQPMGDKVKTNWHSEGKNDSSGKYFIIKLT